MMDFKIVFVFCTPCLKVYYKRYGMEYLVKKGYSVEVFDVSRIVHPQSYNEVTTGLIEEIEMYRFENRKQYASHVTAMKYPCVFIFTEDYCLNNLFLYISLRKEHHYGYMSRLDTNVEICEIGSERCKNYIKELSVERVIGSLFSRIPKRILVPKVADFHLLGGRNNRELYINLANVGKKTIIRHIHSMDYENYLDIKKREERVIDDKYWVFIDQYLPYHPDAVLTDDSQELDIIAREYYSKLRNFFAIVEDYFNIKVIIAAHPRADYGKHKYAYEGYEVYRGITSVLVKDAEVVLCHESTSIVYAVLFGKPIIHITLDMFKYYKNFQEVCYKQSELLKTCMINISEPNQDFISKILKDMYIDYEAYKSYIIKYVKADYDDKELREVSLYPQLLSIIEKSME